MKKIFTLISMAFIAMSMNAQEVYNPIIVDADGNISLAPEFASVVNGTEATNVVDGKSIVTFSTDNLEVQAVGGAVPAKNEEGVANGVGQSQMIDANGNVSQWASIEWKNGNNKLDINDEAGTKLYFVMGTGNPYVQLNAVQCTVDGEPTDYYTANYVYYEPDGSLGMPIVGLYYKFTPKVAGTLKVTIWANKGNRQTFLVDESTMQAIPYSVTGYVNGQKVVNEAGEKVLNSAGQEMMRLFTNEEILERHAASGNAENPYIIDQGNQAFWGWLTFEAEAGKSYWLFQHSSQIGFGGYEFTPDQADGIAEVATAVKSGVRYNLAGQKVRSAYKGVVIENGKKFVR